MRGTLGTLGGFVTLVALGVGALGMDLLLKKKENLLLKFQKNAEMLANLKHPNVISLKEILVIESSCYQIYEFFSNESLLDLCGRIPIDTVLIYFKDVVKGLIYLKKNHLVHEEIEPKNIFIKDGRAKINLDHFFSDPDLNLSFVKKEDKYAAPELDLGDFSDPIKSSVWSSGVLLYEMIFGQLKDRSHKINLIFPDEKEIDETIKDLLKKMMEIDPKKRIDFEGVYKCLKEEIKKENTPLQKKIFRKKSEENKKEEEEEDEKQDLDVKAEMIPVPKYLDFLQAQADFFNDLTLNIVRFKSKWGFHSNQRRILVILFQRISMICYGKILQIVRGNKKDLKDIKAIPEDVLESGVLKGLKSKYSKLFKQYKNDFESKLEDYGDIIEKYGDSFAENLKDFENFEISLKFKNVYSKVFEDVLDILGDRINEFEKLEGKENEEFFSGMFNFMKVKKFGEWEQEYENDFFKRNDVKQLNGNSLKKQVLENLKEENK